MTTTTYIWDGPNLVTVKEIEPTITEMHVETVKIVAISQPTIEGLENPGEMVAYTARVSNPGNQMNTSTSPKLLNYLVKNQHWSPFEMSSVTMEIVTTRDIARQILRHRSFSFQEFSQRYAEAADKLVFRECRLQHPTNRQASLEGASQENKDWFWNMQEACQEHARRAYKEALARGIAKEQARCFLPEGLTESTLYMAGTVRSWIHYIQLRSSEGTQKEHREIAQMCKIELLNHFPELAEVL